MAHDSGLDDETMAGGTPDDEQSSICHCGKPAVVVMNMETANEGWTVGRWYLCEFHAWEALGGAGIDTTKEDANGNLITFNEADYGEEA